MGLSQRYLPSAKNLKAILDKIIEGAPPERFTLEHLSGIGFPSSNDRAIIPLLKDLGFLSADGIPTQRYLDYRDRSRSKRVLGQALRDAYGDLFVINENLAKKDRDAVIGKFKATYGNSDVVAERQAATFFALLDHADISTSPNQPTARIPEEPRSEGDQKPNAEFRRSLRLNYKIEVNLPATRDIEIYNAIFKSMKDHLLDE